MSEQTSVDIITYKDCIKDGLIIAFIINTIIAQILFSSAPVFILFLILTIITALIIYTPVVLVIKNHV